MPHLYSLTLQKAGSINQAVYGNFSTSKAQEIVVSRYDIACFRQGFLLRGKILELLRPDDQGRVQVICSTDAFGILRSLTPFRLVGANRDYLIVGSDSGRIVILEFDPKSSSFVKVHQETFGKSGCRRVVPGEFLAVDPSGRACMIAAVEKQKFVYILNRDLQQRLTISSPLEAHRMHSVVFSICGLDVGFDNPLFASIEANYRSNEVGKMFTIYEMDLGINHVTRKYAEPVPETAHLLIPVLGGNDGPGGCLICCEDFLVYKKLGQANIVCKYPRRVDCEKKKVLITAHARHKLKEFSLVLIQTEFGDLFRVDLVRSGFGLLSQTVESVRISYFDSIPRAVSLCILKTGFLFAASEFGNHGLYQFQATEMLSAALPSTSITSSSSSGSDVSPPSFSPTQTLANLAQFDDVASLCPLVDMKVMDPLTEASSGGSCQIYTACGRGAGSSLRVLRHGLGVTEMALTDLPGKPSGVWAVPVCGSQLSQFIVISFVDVTLVLSVGETVEEVADSGILGSVPSLLVSRMFDNSLLQVHPRGVRLVDSAGKVSEWRSGIPTVVAACNSRQLVVGLAGGELVYLELLQSGTSCVVQEIARRNMGSEVTSLSLSSVPSSRTRGLFVAVSGSDRSVRILSLEPDKILKQLSAQSFPVPAESVAVTPGFLAIGLSNGTLVRCCMDRVSGVLSDPRSRFLGIRPVRLQVIPAAVEESVLALSSRPWLVHATTGTVPLSYMQSEAGVDMPVVLEFASAFASEQCPSDGLVTIAQNTLRIISLEPSGSVFSQQSVPLSHTPRKMLLLPPLSAASNGGSLFVAQQSMLAILEADVASGETGILPPSSTPSSCIRIVDPVGLLTRFKLDFEFDEIATSFAVAFFFQLKDNRPCLIVGTARNLQIPSRECTRAVLKTFLYDANFVPQLVHVTPVDEAPLAMCQFEGRLLVSFAATQSASCTLRLYELGKKRLLKKSEYRNSHCAGFVNLQVVNDRIFAADAFNSIHVLKLNRADGQFYVVCDDVGQRYMSAQLVLDYNTVLGADKFDNLFIGRVPPEVKDEGTGESTTGLRLGPDTSYILGKNKKLDPINSFHLGETVTSLQKVTMSTGAAEVVMYSTLSGGIGVLYPFSSKKEYNLFLALETQMRTEMVTSLVGRDHTAFRSFYLPVKGVIDGDLIATFPTCRNRAQIATNLNRTVNEITKIIEEVHNRIT